MFNPLRINRASFYALVAFVALVCCFIPKTYAKNLPALKCVHEQAASLGLIQKPNDDQFSEQTINAADLISTRFEELKNLRSITSDNAIA
jgi:hypothetical protein